MDVQIQWGALIKILTATYDKTCIAFNQSLIYHSRLEILNGVLQ